MIARPYAAAKRTLSAADKLLEINWGLLLLITLCACAGFAMLYSVAVGQFHPWALAQIIKFVVGLVVLFGVAAIDIRVWMSLAYPAYALAMVLLVAVDVAGHVGLGAQRIHAGDDVREVLLQLVERPHFAVMADEAVALAVQHDQHATARRAAVGFHDEVGPARQPLRQAA